MTPTGPDAPGHPPEPWHLAGRGWLTTWRVPAADLPDLPAGVRPLRVRGTGLVVTAFVDYDDRGDLAYHELLAAVVVRRGRGVALSVTDIWVDSAESLRGGRALWGIPKQRADFRGLAATHDDAPVAFAAFLPHRRVPVPALPLPTLPSATVQTRLDGSGEVVVSPVRAGGRVRPVRADWTFPSAGPLGWLRGAGQVLSVVADPFSMTFGAAPAR